MKKSVRKAIADATVRFPRLGGLGVIVSDSFIVTAAHVVQWTATGEMTLSSSDFWEDVEVGSVKIRAAIYAVEPVADIAILGSPDNQIDCDGAAGFEATLERIRPVMICTTEFELFQPFDAHILTHNGTWVAGTAQQCSKDAHLLAFHANEQIVGGTSGGPVVTDGGLLLGVVSNANQSGGIDGGACNGLIPRPHLTAPSWLARRICG